MDPDRHNCLSSMFHTGLVLQGTHVRLKNVDNAKLSDLLRLLAVAEESSPAVAFLSWHCCVGRTTIRLT
jgi:hypothetical protein